MVWEDNNNITLATVSFGVDTERQCRSRHACNGHMLSNYVNFFPVWRNSKAVNLGTLTL